MFLKVYEKSSMLELVQLRGGGKNYKCLCWNLKFWELVSFPPVDNVVSCEHSDDCKNKISTSSFNQSPDKTSEG